MARKRTSKFEYYHYTDDEFRMYLDENFSSTAFKDHCREVAEILGINPGVVQDVLRHKSLSILCLLQKSVLQKKRIKINIFGFFRLVTNISYLNKSFSKSNKNH